MDPARKIGRPLLTGAIAYGASRVIFGTSSGTMSLGPITANADMVFAGSIAGSSFVAEMIYEKLPNQGSKMEKFEESAIGVALTGATAVGMGYFIEGGVADMQSAMTLFAIAGGSEYASGMAWQFVGPILSPLEAIERAVEDSVEALI